MQTTRAEINFPTYPSKTTYDTKLHTLEENVQNQNNRLSKLEECCSTLADTTKTLASQMMVMSNNMNTKFRELAVTINQVHNSPNRRSNKQHRNSGTNQMDLDH